MEIISNRATVKITMEKLLVFIKLIEMVLKFFQHKMLKRLDQMQMIYVKLLISLQLGHFGNKRALNLVHILQSLWLVLQALMQTDLFMLYALISILLRIVMEELAIIMLQQQKIITSRKDWHCKLDKRNWQLVEIQPHMN